MGADELSRGFPSTTAVLGVLIIGAVFKGLEETWQESRKGKRSIVVPETGDQKLRWPDIKRLLPHISRSALIGTGIGALPGVGSTLAATLGYSTARARYAKSKDADAAAFGEGAPEGIAATEAANSAVSGANLIPVLSLGIPGNAAAVFLILATETIGGFNPGPSVFRFSHDVINPELVVAFGLFTCMTIANLFNWTIGGVFMRSMGFMIRIPKQLLLPSVLLLTLTAIYVQETRIEAIWFALGFGVLGYFMRVLAISPLPFVIAFILGKSLEETARQAYSATGNDPFFLFNNPIALAFILMSVAVIFFTGRKAKKAAP